MADFILRHFFGFALQTGPATLLLLLPFDRNTYRLRPPLMRTVISLAVLLLSGIYAFGAAVSFRESSASGGTGYPFGNAFMLASILAFAVLYFVLIRDEPLKKLLVLFSVVAFASVQYSLVNVLLSLDPIPPTAQLGQTYDYKTCTVYLIVTAVLLPIVAVFFRRSLRTYLNQFRSEYRRWEFGLLAVTTVLYLSINALFAMFWSQFRESLQINQSYSVPLILLLTIMLALAYYSVIKLANLRAEDADRKTEAAVIRMDHARISRDIENQRERLHDTRQLLRTLYMLAKSGDMDELQAYYDKTVEHIQLTDESFCRDLCMNSILQYYASLAASAGIGFSTQARCADLSSISETDLTVLIGNALENAIDSAKAYRLANPDKEAVVRLTAEDAQNLLCVQIENPCVQVTYAPGSKPTSDGGFLPASAFTTTNGAGHGNGLTRMDAITKKYDGVAGFRYYPDTQTFLTRLTLILP